MTRPPTLIAAARAVRMLSLAAALLAANAGAASAESASDQVRVVEAEATYTMGDSDTLASAEENVMLRAKRKAVESVGVYIETSSTDVETAAGDQTKHLNSLGVRTIAAAVTETEVLDQRRALENGRLVLSIKIRTKVHIDWLQEAIKRLKANEQLAEHHRQLHAEYNQLRSELDHLRNQIKENGALDTGRGGMSTPNRKQARDLVRAAIETRSLPDKIDLATKAIAADGTYVDAYIIRGQTYLRIASLDYSKREKRSDLSTYVEQAVTDFDRAISIAPTSTWALLGRGDALTWQRKTAEAARDYERTLQVDPLFDIGRQRLIALYTSQARKQVEAGKWREALGTLDHLLVGESPRGWIAHQKDAYLLRSRVYRQLGDAERAVADLTTVVSVDPTNAEAFIERGRLYQKMLQGRLAKEDFERACVLGREEGCTQIQ
jgi:tetratricopeptide (TPR) repeat protein